MKHLLRDGVEFAPGMTVIDRGGLEYATEGCEVIEYPWVVDERYCVFLRFPFCYHNRDVLLADLYSSQAARLEEELRRLLERKARLERDIAAKEQAVERSKRGRPHRTS